MNKALSFIIYHLSFSAALCVVLMACQHDDDGLTDGTTDGTPIAMGVNVEGSGTRAGQTANMDYHQLTYTSFGVYAYGPYAKDGSYSSSATKLFDADNTPMTYTGSETDRDKIPADLYLYNGNWSYGATRYWDQTGRRYTFLAYAPYVKEGSGTTGITAVSTSGEPTISYAIGTSPDECVDLLWGVNERTGMPWRDVTLADTGGPVLFTMRHALAAIGFHVQAMVDKENNTSDTTDVSEVASLLGQSGRYKLTIKKLELKGKFYPSGTLSLNNTTKYTPLWSKNAAEEKTLTVGNNFINASFKHPGDAATDAAMAQTIMTNTSLTGVTQAAQQLLVSTTTQNGKPVEQSFFVIPTAPEPASSPQATPTYTATLYWCISGQAPDGTYVAEDRASDISISDLTLQAGVKYYLNFVIGLRTLQLSVSAEDWTGQPLPVTVTIERGTSASSSLSRRKY